MNKQQKSVDGWLAGRHSLSCVSVVEENSKGIQQRRKGEAHLRLVVCHLLHQRLVGELLRAAGEVLGRVGGARRHNGWSGHRGRVHHGGRARRMVLV